MSQLHRHNQPLEDALCNAEHQAELIRRLGPALVLFARQRCRSGDDVVQDAFVKLFRLPEPPANAPAWLFQVVRRDASNAARSERRREYHERAAAEQRFDWFLPSLEDSLEVETVTRSLQSMPLDEREVIVARIWGELTFDEIASVIGTSPSTASRRYHTALEALKQKLDVTSTETKP